MFALVPGLSEPYQERISRTRAVARWPADGGTEAFGATAVSGFIGSSIVRAVLRHQARTAPHQASETAAYRAAPRSPVSSFRMTHTGIEERSGRRWSLSRKDSRKTSHFSAGRILGAMPPPR